MADAITPLTKWRRSREVVIREAVKPFGGDASMHMLAALAERVERLERVIAALAAEAARGDGC